MTKDIDRDLFRSFGIAAAFGAIALLLFFVASCATCPAGDPSPRCRIQIAATDCGKALAGPDGADIVATVLKDLANGADGAAWTADLLALATRVGFGAVECAIGQIEGIQKGSTPSSGAQAELMAKSGSKIGERIRIWKSLPRDAQGRPAVPAARSGTGGA